jgi:hypothetical protein
MTFFGNSSRYEKVELCGLGKFGQLLKEISVTGGGMTIPRTKHS